MIKTALVAVDKAAFTFDDLFEYIVPENMNIAAGMRVLVPFGRRSKTRVGAVFSLSELDDGDPRAEKLKTLFGAFDDAPVLNEEMLYLARYMQEKTFCTYYDAVKTMLPPGLNIFSENKYSLDTVTAALTRTSGTLTEPEIKLLSEAASCESESELGKLCKAPENAEAAAGLIKKNIIKVTEGFKRRVGDETQRTVRLIEPPEGEQIKLSPKQKAVLDTLRDVGAASVKEICYLCSVTPSVIANLEKKGLAEVRNDEVSRALSKNAEATAKLSDIVFSPLQQRTFEGLAALMDENAPRCALLHGITGSGKTSVFIKLIERCEKSGRTAILLIPEISLTPQTVGKFQSLFGNTVAIIHSELSLGQRADEYKRIKNGEAHIVIGTRSAVFAPLENIGLIVIDEEDEHTYRSDRSPRYHARDIAKQRCFRHNALLLLASATPSFDSYHSALTGKYALFEMNERYSGGELPEVMTVDMRVEAENGNRGNFSELLLAELKYNLEMGEQSMLLLNRRGFNTFINCIKCGEVVECPNCGIPLTYHKVNDSVICHYCGFMKAMPHKCEKCGSSYMYSSGTGTQRIEEEIKQYFPSARVLRMDADTTMSKFSYERRFKEFADNEYDIMVGTQMIAKGLDFENVTLVGVLLIDRSLYAGDYLGYEKTFSLITQVVGRAGRGRKKGRALLQTFSPEHYVLRLAAKQDYKGFYEQESEIRKALIFPPYCELCVIMMSGTDKTALDAAALLMKEILSESSKGHSADIPMIILGPVENGRINGSYRSRIIIKCRADRSFRTLLRGALHTALKDKKFKDIGLYTDLNGEVL